MALQKPLIYYSGNVSQLPAADTLDASGGLTVTGAGSRFVGNFSDATFANRTAFQTNGLNAGTSLEVIPNGTGQFSQCVLGVSQDMANTSTLVMRAGSDVQDVRISSAYRGTGSLLPLAFYIHTSERFRLHPTANRFQGEFTSATVSDRLMFQTSYTNGTTSVRVIPNGTNTAAALQVGNSSDANNQSVLSMAADSSQGLIQMQINGTGTYLPLMFATSGVVCLNMGTDGNVLATRGAIGYGSGAGGTVTQATSKATAVTLNKPNGTITTAADALGAGAETSFAVNNTFCATGDGIVVNNSSSGSYVVRAGRGAGGVFNVFIKNVTAGVLSESVIIDFKIVKGSTT